MALTGNKVIFWWSNVDQDASSHMVSPGPMELTDVSKIQNVWQVLLSDWNDHMYIDIIWLISRYVWGIHQW